MLLVASGLTTRKGTKRKTKTARVKKRQGVAGDSRSQRPTKTLHVSRDMSQGRLTHVPAFFNFLRLTLVNQYS